MSSTYKSIYHEPNVESGSSAIKYSSPLFFAMNWDRPLDDTLTVYSSLTTLMFSILKFIVYVCPSPSAITFETVSAWLSTYKEMYGNMCRTLLSEHLSIKALFE